MFRQIHTKIIPQRELIDLLYRIRYNINIKEIRQYTKQNGKSPYDESIKKFDKSIRTRIEIRLARVQHGNYGDVKQLSNNLFELRCQFGNGVRIYFTEIENTIIILLCAGDKSTQTKDIEKAKEYLNDLFERGTYE